ncbi:uncharacterized protein LOC105837592 isoform X3 [Monomorium pharaonis]|uniref:uncharacterized protein LOC105837592 isoform X3 n=1 Tax=Monomorium pharaonis TaxID=307658 RepID=UPI00102E1A02|nr:uncharacterized protein LOC105837592 isoform X3 [Monomorium pharaonis]
MNYNTRLTEECPLTKERSYKHRIYTYCGNGLKFIVVCFVALTVAITTMLVLQILYTENIPQSNLHGIHGAVATDYSNCSQIGTKILARLGNAIDAAVAATICMALVAPHKTGLGGVGYIMIYNYKNYTHPIVIDFTRNTTTGIYYRKRLLLKGDFFAEAEIRLPALLKGLECAQKLYGNLPWRDVVEPTIELAREGFVISKDLADEVSKNTDYEIFYAGPLNPGDRLQLEELTRTLDIVARNGVKENASTIESQALVAQTLMHVYLQCSQNMQQEVKKETYTGVMAMDWQDTYVSILSGLSSPFGRGSKVAGFFLDNINNDLSTFIPIIFHYKGICGLRGVFGSKDVFLNGQILYNLIMRALNVSTVVEYPRYYFASDGMVIENNQRHSMEAALQARLYSMISSLSHDDNLSMTSVNAIVKRKDSLSSHSDSRGNGIASRF